MSSLLMHERLTVAKATLIAKCASKHLVENVRFKIINLLISPEILLKLRVLWLISLIGILLAIILRLMVFVWLILRPFTKVHEIFKLIESISAFVFVMIHLRWFLLSLLNEIIWLMMPDRRHCNNNSPIHIY